MKFLRKITKNIKKNKKLYRRLILFVFFGAIAGVYFHNVTRDVYSGDIGDLVTAAWVFGVAHPPGYPLFTFLGYLFSHYLPFIDLPPVSKVAFISVISSVVGLIFIYKFAIRVTKSLYLSLLSTSILAFSYLYWLQAEIPEVFGFNNLFVILILYYALLFYQEKQAKHLYMLVFLCGLSLTHQHIILFIFPSIYFLIMKHYRFVFFNPKRIIIMLGLFILGLLPYIYVPIAASQNPVINWNNAANLDNFIKLVLRQSYGDFAPGILSTPVVSKLLVVKDYLLAIVSNFSYQIVIVFLLGILYLCIKQKLLAIALLIGLFLTGPFFVFYGAPSVDNEASLGIIERFYVFSSILFMIIVVYGFNLIKILLSTFFQKKQFYSNILLLYFLIIPLFLFIYNYPKTNLSNTTMGNNLVIDMFVSIPKNSVLIVSGDSQTFNTWYMRYVLGYRNDIDIVNSIGIGSNHYLEGEINKYKAKNPKVKPSDEYIFTIEEIRKKRKIFNVYNGRSIAPSTILIPKGLVFELIDKSEVPSKSEYEKEMQNIIKKYHIPRRTNLKSYDDNLISTEIPLIYSEAFIQIGNFFSYYYKDFKKADYYYRKALWTDNEYHHAYAILGLNQYNDSKNCKNATKNIRKAIDLYPVRKDYYQYLYDIYKKCNTDKKEILSIEKKYNEIFRTNIISDKKPKNNAN